MTPHCCHASRNYGEQEIKASISMHVHLLFVDDPTHRLAGYVWEKNSTGELVDDLDRAYLVFQSLLLSMSHVLCDWFLVSSQRLSTCHTHFPVKPVYCNILHLGSQKTPPSKCQVCVGRQHPSQMALTSFSAIICDSARD